VVKKVKHKVNPWGNKSQIQSMVFLTSVTLLFMFGSWLWIDRFVALADRVIPAVAIIFLDMMLMGFTAGYGWALFDGRYPNYFENLFRIKK